MDLSKARSVKSDSCSTVQKATKDDEFAVGTLVFAKVYGHKDPPWPAKILEVCKMLGNRLSFKVFFYGTYEIGDVFPDKIWAYNDKSVAEFSNPSIKYRKKLSQFRTGMKEVIDNPSIADFPDTDGPIVKESVTKTTALNQNFCSGGLKRKRGMPIWMTNGKTEKIVKRRKENDLAPKVSARKKNTGCPASKKKPKDPPGSRKCSLESGGTPPGGLPPLGPGMSQELKELDECVVVKTEPLSANPNDWSVIQTISQVKQMDQSLVEEDFNILRTQRINGRSLLQLTFEDLVVHCKMKVGPAKTLERIIGILKTWLCTAR